MTNIKDVFNLLCPAISLLDNNLWVKSQMSLGARFAFFSGRLHWYVFNSRCITSFARLSGIIMGAGRRIHKTVTGCNIGWQNTDVFFFFQMYCTVLKFQMYWNTHSSVEFVKDWPIEIPVGIAAGLPCCRCRRRRSSHDCSTVGYG